MKKLLALMLSLVMLLSYVQISTFASSQISVTIDGTKQNYDVMPVIQNGRTLVPMRGIFEALGAEINWDETTKTVTGTKGDIDVSLTIGDTSAKVNQKEVILDVPAIISNGRTLVPVRFISETLGCEVNWDDSAKTVIINSQSDSKLAKLVSEVHRPVPTEFTASNSMDDMLYFTAPPIEEQEKIYKEVRKLGEVVCSTEEFMSKLTPFDSTVDNYAKFGSYEVVDVKDMEFTKALRITCTKVANPSANFIVRTDATTERVPGEGLSPDDVMLLAFRFRIVSGGAPDGTGQVQFQIENPVGYRKAVFTLCTATPEWNIMYIPFTGVENATSMGIRAGFYEQVVEIGGIEIINFGPGFDSKKLPATSSEFPELKEGAQWRDDAIKRIEEIRKGDFSVVVKDKEGNVIPDAQVELDMFEHEFHFGTCVNAWVTNTNEPDYANKLSENYNASVTEHELKWGPYSRNPSNAQEEVKLTQQAGIKYIRAHSIVFDSNDATNMPAEFQEGRAGNYTREEVVAVLKEHVDKLFKDDFDGVFTDCDVANEIIRHRYLRSSLSKDGKPLHYSVTEMSPAPDSTFEDNTLFVDYFRLVREATDGKVDLWYNEAWDVYTDRYIEYLDTFKALGVDYDGLGIQSHYDGALKMPTEQIALYNKLAEYGKKLKVTEYSCSTADESLQANFTRDTMIACFAQPEMNGFLMWGFWDGYNYEAYGPMYYSDWTLKPSGRVYQDLVYNKWWTRDARANTDKDGKATIRGFYGDYDVTVTANGQTKTAMVAFHKGYDNILEITLD